MCASIPEPSLYIDPIPNDGDDRSSPIRYADQAHENICASVLRSGDGRHCPYRLCRLSLSPGERNAASQFVNRAGDLRGTYAKYLIQANF